jgi:hypothetical protein
VRQARVAVPARRQWSADVDTALTPVSVASRRVTVRADRATALQTKIVEREMVRWSPIGFLSDSTCPGLPDEHQYRTVRSARWHRVGESVAVVRGHRLVPGPAGPRREEAPVSLRLYLLPPRNTLPRRLHPSRRIRGGEPRRLLPLCRRGSTFCGAPVPCPCRVPQQERASRRARGRRRHRPILSVTNAAAHSRSLPAREGWDAQLPRGRLTGAFHGSVSRYLLRHSPCPTMLCCPSSHPGHFKATAAFPRLPVPASESSIGACAAHAVA